MPTFGVKKERGCVLALRRMTMPAGPHRSPAPEDDRRRLLRGPRRGRVQAFPVHRKRIVQALVRVRIGRDRVTEGMAGSDAKGRRHREMVGNGVPDRRIEVVVTEDGPPAFGRRLDVGTSQDHPAAAGSGCGKRVGRHRLQGLSRGKGSDPGNQGKHLGRRAETYVGSAQHAGSYRASGGPGSGA